MKRSKIVHQISDNVITSFFSSLDLKTKNLIADCCLHECERMGMLPPPIQKEMKEWTTVSKYKVYEWEPE